MKIITIRNALEQPKMLYYMVTIILKKKATENKKQNCHKVKISLDN